MTRAVLAPWSRLAHEDGRSPLPPCDDIATVAQLLIANRLGPAVARAVRLRAETAGLAPELAAMLREEARRAAEGSLKAIATLHRAAQSLHRAGIAWMLWKGPALSAMVWGEPGIRQFSDLDIVVAPRDRDSARAALATDGWRAREGYSAAQERAVHAATRAYPLECDGSTTVELHWAFAGTRYPSWGDVAAIVSRATTVELGGITVRTPAGADALLLSALHATKHGWSQAEDAVLFTRLATRYPEAIAIANARAEDAGVGTAMRLGARLAARLCGVALPELPISRSEDERVAALVEACIARVESGAGDWRKTHAWTLAWVRRPMPRLRYARVALFAPTPQERQWVALPDWLVWTYPAVRLARLALRTVGLAR